MEIQPLLSELFLRQLKEKDEEGIRRSIASAGGQGDGCRHLVGTMRSFTCLHKPPQGETSAIVVIDALADLMPLFEGGSPTALLAAGASYLMSLPVSAPRVELLDVDPNEPTPDFVPVGALEEALARGQVEATCWTVARLARVIRTREYFLEVLLEAVAPEQSPAGRFLVQTNATVKAMREIEWEASQGIAYRLLEALSERPLPAAPFASENPPPLPCRAGYLASLERENPEDAWLYLSHAFQAERYAQLRQKGVRWGLRAWVTQRLFHGDEAGMDRAEKDLGPRQTEGGQQAFETVPIDPGTWILEKIASGSSAASTEAGLWAEKLPDVDPLYRWIAEGVATALARGNPKPLVTVNAARWGAHLLGPAGAGVLTRRLIERLATLMADPA